MTFKQRLKFYFIGFGIGVLVLLMVLNRRGCKGLNVNAQKVEQLAYQKWEISAAMHCKLNCLGFTADSLFVKDVKTCKVNYSADATNASLKPCGNYVLESSAKSTATYTLLVADCNGTSRLLDIIVKTNCTCK